MGDDGRLPMLAGRVADVVRQVIEQVRMVYSRSLARPVVAVVGDIFHHLQLYVAARDDHGTDRAVLITADSATYPLTPATSTPPAEALVTNYLMRPAERLLPLAAQHRLLAAALSAGEQRGRIGVDFGSVGLAHVAAGFTDAMIEFAKGFAIWDLAPGHYLLHAAGGHVVDLDGTPYSWTTTWTPWPASPKR
jgi:myo-inositol-1(or 4)-monophosphatase